MANYKIIFNGDEQDEVFSTYEWKFHLNGTPFPLAAA